MEYISAIHELLFPTRDLCYLCRERYDNIHGSICDNCRRLLQVLNREIIMDSSFIEKAYYAIMYNRFAKEIVADFKFNGKSYLYRPLGELMVDTIRAKKLEGLDIVLFVPSHRRREAIRGYNQSGLLANHISKSIGLPISNKNLMKIRHTKEQSSLDRHCREANLRDAFKLKDKSEIYGKRILLIDDIITTGFTMIECAKLLMENGASEVIGLALTSSKRL